MHIGQTEEVPFISPDLPEIIQNLIRGCLVRDPKQRLRVKEMLKIIEESKKQ